jgi:hypothetical protein
MARFEKFDSTKQLQGLAEAARQIQIEELIRNGKMPSFDQVVAAIDETRKRIEREQGHDVALRRLLGMLITH